MTIDNNVRTMIWEPRQPGPGCGPGHWEGKPDPPDRFQPRQKSNWEKRQEFNQVRAQISRIENELGICRFGGGLDRNMIQPFNTELPDWIRPRQKTCCCHNPREQMLRMELSMLRCREQQLERDLQGSDDWRIMPYAKAM